MKIFNTKIASSKIICTNPYIPEQFYVESYDSTTMDNDVYVWSDNGHCSVGIVSFNGNIQKAFQYAKGLMTTYFKDRGEKNPKGF